MRLFGRARGVQHPVFAFWSWWAETGHTIDPSTLTDLHGELARRIAAVDAGLTWHFGKGTQAEHRLTVSAGGVAESRPAAERWLRAARSSGERWEFRSSQEADPDALDSTLSIAGDDLDLRQIRYRIVVDDDRLRVDVGVHHPRFRELEPLVCGNVTFLVLDWLLGEDDVERWVGEVEPLTVDPLEPRTSEDLRTAVAALTTQRDPDRRSLAVTTDERGMRTFVIWQPGQRWIDAPTMDRHHEIEAQIADAPGRGRDDVDALDDELVALLGDRGVFVARTTRTDGLRTIHVYSDGEDQNVSEALGTWAHQRALKITSQADPGWRAVRHITG